MTFPPTVTTTRDGFASIEMGWSAPGIFIGLSAMICILLPRGDTGHVAEVNDLALEGFSPFRVCLAVRREICLEHGPPALRRLSGRLVLDDVPMLGDQAVFDTYDVDHDPVHRLPDPRNPAVEHNIVAVGDDQR